MKFDWREFLKKYDYSFFLTAAVIFFIGVMNLYSATHNDLSENVRGLHLSQLVWFLIATIVGFIVSMINTKTIFRFAYIIYGAIFSLLVLVLIAGRIGMGAKRWLDLGPIHLQPSELMKMALVIFLARWFTRHDPDLPLDFKGLIIPAILTLIPAALIIIQPDLGTGGLLILVFAGLAFYRRLKWQTILSLSLMGIVTSGVMYKYVLKDYQRKRIEMFLNPYKDAKG